MNKDAINYTQLQAFEVSAEAARQELLVKLEGLESLAACTAFLLHLMKQIVNKEKAPGVQLSSRIVANKDKLEPLANSLGFTILPSPTVVGAYVLQIGGAA
jgi:hypothetical protein